MQTLKFKTNINCGSCINAVTPALNSDKRIQKWEVDVVDPDKILTVQAAENMLAAEVAALIKEAGFEANAIEALAI